MDDGSSDIMAGIKALRAKAEAQLTGNEYYMITQQLDALAASAELDGAARSILSSIESRLNGAGAGEPAAASTDVPTSPPSTELQIEEIVVPAPAAGSFFGGAHATASAGFAEVQPETAAAPVAETPKGLRAAVDAVRTFIEGKLSGNHYYTVANLLDQLRSFPPAPGGRETFPAPASFDEALELLRGEIGWLSGFAQVEASRLVNALARIATPPAEPAPEPAAAAVAAPAAEPAPQPTPAAAPATEPAEAPAPSGFDLADAAGPESEEGPRVGFDDLADASWQRVKAVAQAERGPAQSLNGSSAPVTAMPEAEPVSAQAAVHTEPMVQDMGEALDDGGSERRSSEPCYAAEFELETGTASHGGDEPAGQTDVPQQEVETARETALSAEAEALTGLTEPEQAPVESAAEASPPEVAEEIVAAVIVEEKPEETPVAAEEQLAETPATVEAAAAATESPVAETVEAVPEEPKRKEPRRQAANRGLFGRLFGGRAAGHP